MKFVMVSGGLGNQMFNFALAISLNQKGYNTSLLLPFHKHSKFYGYQGYELNKVFNINRKKDFIVFLLEIYSNIIRIFPKEWKRILYKIIGINLVKVPENFIYYADILNCKNRNELYSGTWQSYKYFDNALSIIKSSFTFNKEKLSLTTLRLREIIKNCESVSLHIRRRDYLNERYISGFGDICTEEYYSAAISIIKLKIDNPVFFIFSDDKKWISSHVIIENSVIIDFNEDENCWQDMYLMSECRHNVIANSTFSWWGAWLNSYPDKMVIAPKIWWRSIPNDDVVPDNWIRI